MVRLIEWVLILGGLFAAQAWAIGFAASDTPAAYGLNAAVTDAGLGLWWAAACWFGVASVWAVFRVLACLGGDEHYARRIAAGLAGGVYALGMPGYLWDRSETIAATGVMIVFGAFAWYLLVMRRLPKSTRPTAPEDDESAAETP